MFLIDGYNLMYKMTQEMDKNHQTVIKDFRGALLEKQREKLLLKLSSIFNKTKQEIRIIFDNSTQSSPFNTVKKFNNITVVFTKCKESADNYIVNFVRTAQHPGNITVVTSDLEIQKRISYTKVGIIKSEDFIKKYFATYTNNHIDWDRTKGSKKLSDEEINYWLKVQIENFYPQDKLSSS